MARIRGTNGGDWTWRTKGSDRIDGRRGNDLIVARGGNDRVNGGDRNDWIFAGDGNDRVDGGRGDDFIYAGSGDDRIDGGRGNDTICTVEAKRIRQLDRRLSGPLPRARMGPDGRGGELLLDVSNRRSPPRHAAITDPSWRWPGRFPRGP